MKLFALIALVASSVPVAAAEAHEWLGKVNACIVEDASVLIPSGSATQRSEVGRWESAPKTFFVRLRQCDWSEAYDSKTGLCPTHTPDEQALFGMTTTLETDGIEEAAWQPRVGAYAFGPFFGALHHIILTYDGQFYYSSFNRTNEASARPAWFTLSGKCTPID